MDENQDAERLRDWYVSELQRLGFGWHETEHLVELLQAGELDLASFRDLIEKRGWTPKQAFLSAA